MIEFLNEAFGCLWRKPKVKSRKNHASNHARIRNSNGTYAKSRKVKINNPYGKSTFFRMYDNWRKA